MTRSCPIREPQTANKNIRLEKNPMVNTDLFYKNQNNGHQMTLLRLEDNLRSILSFLKPKLRIRSSL